MSLRVIGHRNGQRVVVDEGPNPAIVHQHTFGTRAVVGGSLDFRRPSAMDIQRHATLIATRRLRAARRELALDRTGRPRA